jgi:uncharacterized protein (DUF952 family)
VAIVGHRIGPRKGPIVRAVRWALAVPLPYSGRVADLPTSIAWHLVPANLWNESPPGEPFRAASLASEGFVHLTHGLADLVEVANAFYRDEAGPHVVLAVDLSRLTSPWRYDGDERFPHVYGPLDLNAITSVRPILRAADGTYLPIEPLAAANG